MPYKKGTELWHWYHHPINGIRKGKILGYVFCGDVFCVKTDVFGTFPASEIDKRLKLSREDALKELEKPQKQDETPKGCDSCIKHMDGACRDRTSCSERE